MGKIGSGVKAGFIGGLVSGVFIASVNIIIMTVYKEAYINMFKKASEKLTEEYGVELPQGSPEEVALVMYNLSRIQGSIYAILMAVIIGIVVGAIVAKFYGKLPFKNPLAKALLISYIILAIKTSLSLAFSGIGGFKPEELGVSQEITVLSYITDIVSHTILGLVIGALYGKWVLKAEEALEL